MLRLMVAALVCVAFVGCSWIADQQDPEVAKARTEADAAIVEARDLKAKRAEAESRHALDVAAAERKLVDAEARHAIEIEQARAVADADARRVLEAAAAEKLAAAKAAVEARMVAADQKRDSARSEFDKGMETADGKLAALDSAIDAAASKGSKLGVWGATAGSIFGPAGTAIGGILGTIAASIWGLVKSRNLKALAIGYQASREELARKAPEALQLSDQKLKEVLPARIQEWIQKQKKRGAIPELPKSIMPAPPRAA